VKESWPSEWGIDPARLAASAHRVNVWLDGKLVWSDALEKPGSDPSASNIGVGVNTQGFSTAQGVFPGKLTNFSLTEPDTIEFLRRNLGARP
jgi:hypothetical protein